MNRKERRMTPVLFVGGPIDGRVYHVPANRISYECALIPQRFDTDLNPVLDQNPQPLSVKYSIKKLRGHLNTWRIAWPAEQSRLGCDRALCKVFQAYSSNPGFCGEGELVEGENPEVDG